jgi:hypothetical protein
MGLGLGHLASDADLDDVRARAIRACFLVSPLYRYRFNKWYR